MNWNQGMYRKMLSSVLLSLLTLVLVLPTFLQHALQLHRYVTQNDLHSCHHLESLTFTKGEWAKVEFTNSKEVLINERPFDIQTIIADSNMIQIVGKFDLKEDGLLSLSKKFQDNHSTEEDQLPFFSFFFVENQPSFSFYTKLFSSHSYNSFESRLLSYEMMDESPPPKI